MLKIFANEQLVADEIKKEMLTGLAVEQPVFCLASGSTPAKGYHLFAKMSSKDKNIHKLKIVSLDEWVGVDQKNSGSCYQMLDNDLFSKLNLHQKQVNFYNGMATNLQEECERIDDFIAKQPLTFSLMGVGMNGHIGLNEPGFSPLNHSSVVELSETTKAVAQKYFTEYFPLKQGLTLGLKQIINSKRVVVVITGLHKAEIVKEIFTNQALKLPAQSLLGHEHIDFYLDELAAKHLNLKARGLI